MQANRLAQPAVMPADQGNLQAAQQMFLLALPFHVLLEVFFNGGPLGHEFVHPLDGEDPHGFQEVV